MPTLNKKLFFRLVVLMLLTTGAIYGAHYLQAGRVSRALLWQSQHAYDNGKLDKSIYYLRYYLEFKPDDHEVTLQLADRLLERGNSPKEMASVLFLYEKILRDQPEDEVVRRRAIDTCLRVARYADAFDHAQVLLQTQPEDGLLWQQIATCQMNQTKVEDAKASFIKSIQFAPNNVRTYELFAYLNTKHLNQSEAAAQILNDMVRNNRSAADAYLVRARYFVSANRSKDCERDLVELLRLDPENADALLMQAEILQARGDVKQVRALLSEAADLHHRDVRMYRSLSWIELCAGNRPAATACLERGIKQLPNQTELLTPLADLLIQDGDLEKVSQIVKKLEQRRTVGSQISYLKARLLMRQEQWENATKVLEALRTEAVNLPGLAIQVNLLLATCHGNLTEHGAEIEALQRVLSLDPNNIQARISVGQLMLNQGKMDEAIREFQQVVRSPYAPLEAQMLLGSIRIAKARVVKASEEEWNDIGEYVRKFRERYRTATEPALLGVELLTTRKRYDDAVKLLLAERGRRPNDARLWVRLAEVKELALGFQAAQETLDEGQAILGDLVDLRLARAKLWSHSLSLQKADVMKSLESGVDSFAEADQVRLLYGLADLYSGVQETASVKRMYQVIAARFPTDVPIRTALAQLALSEKDEALYMAMKTQIAALEGEHPRTLPLLEVEHTLAFAKNPSEDKLLRDAKTQVEGMLKVSPTRADATQVLGRIAEAQGDFATARQLYAKAYDLDRTNLNHLKQHARFLWRTNQDVAAVKLMTDLYIDPRVSPEQFRQIFESVMTLLPEKAYGKAMVWVQKFFTEDAPSLVWVADMLWERKKADEAIALYQAARKLDPNLADPYTHLVCRLCESKRLDEMEVVVEEARAGLTSQAFYFLCAHTSDLVRERLQQEWLPKLADAEQRRNLAQATLTLHLSQNQRKSAMHVLQTVADATESRPEDVAWAKRNLSLLQAIDGTPEERRQALRYLAETKPGKQTIEERRAQVAILVLASRQLDSVERKIVLKDAIESLNEILQTPKVATTKDLYHLAQLQRIAGNPKGYQESLLKLMQQEPANISYLTAYVDDLLLGNQLDTAMPHVTRLQEQFAGDFRAVSVIARYYQMKYAPERVLDVCESYIRGVEPGSNEAMLRVRRIADLLEQLIQTGGIDHPSTMALVPAAIEKYQACLRSYPDGIVALVALQAMSGQTSAVFDQLTRLKPTMSKRVLTSAGLATLRNGQATERQYQTVAGWINEALAEQPQSLAIRLSMAEYHTLHQNFADAEAAYLDVLKIDPNNVMALNNLAWILSPKADNAPQALEYVQRAIAISGHTGELLDTRARILIATGKYDRAVEDLTEALNQSQTSLRYFHLSMVKLKQSQNEEALAAFRQAKLYGISARSIHPNDLPAYKMLATQVGQ